MLCKGLTGDISTSFTNIVAPLLEFRTGMGMEEQRGQELESERRRIGADNRVFRRVFRVVKEEKDAPFPMSIKFEKKQAEKMVYDMQEAVRQVKALFFFLVCHHALCLVKLCECKPCFENLYFKLHGYCDEMNTANCNLFGRS